MKNLINKLKHTKCLFLVICALELTSLNVQTQCASNVILLIDKSGYINGQEIMDVRAGLANLFGLVELSVL